MECPKCNCSLSISKMRIEFEGDESPDTETKAFNVLESVCTNPKCDNYSADLNNPTVIVETLRHPVN
jgi:hypothetical protein